MRKRFRSVRTRSLHEKLSYIILTIVIPLLICMVFILTCLSVYAYKYSQITHNVSVSSKFSIDFKSDIDLKMYHYTVGSKEQKDLPIKEVDDAIVLAMSLQKTTHKKESREAINNIRNYCYNLKKRMYEIADTKGYEERNAQLENNIYILTNLIQKRMMDYLYYEAGDMAQLQQVMTRNTVLLIVSTIVIVVIMMIVVLSRSFRFTHSITDPIEKLCSNIKKVGKGEFSIGCVDSDSYEITNLDIGIQQMASRISVLLQNVKEEQLLQHKTELMLIQAQVSPHFLYNTLDTIIWLVESGKNDDAVLMISDLSVFFRTMLSNGDDVITLEDEIKHTRSYLSIQQSRYRDILDFSMECPEELLSCRLPKLSLQPLVENALYHGVKEKRGKSYIKIICQKDKQEIKIIVVDNGVGMTKEELEEIRSRLKNKQKSGFGLRAVEERIVLYYGEQYGITIDSEKGKGTVVTMRLPLKSEPNS
ncbi:MAG: sensor histidine kinase [bacterium]|nr:sensor histidine kinase [bacterium]